MSETTKRALAMSLKKLLDEKPLEKITINDITSDCGVNRQTFYYHFQDIYDLIEWMYTTAAEKAIGERNTYQTWQEGYLNLFCYLQENRSFVINTYHSLSREHLENYLYDKVYVLLKNVVDEVAQNRSIREEDKAFIANFYKYGFVGLTLEWVKNGMKEDPQMIIRRLETLIQGNFPEAVERFSNH
jgi:probable dihydroxyacetone kinase regulator